MPEGHTIHRIAKDHGALLIGLAVQVSSPQGRFEADAARIDGLVLNNLALFRDPRPTLGVESTFSETGNPADRSRFICVCKIPQRSPRFWRATHTTGHRFCRAFACEDRGFASRFLAQTLRGA